ncbi:MAG TPA: hypothetical protein VH951_13100 [Dehalococcoidia bacterium]
MFGARFIAFGITLLMLFGVIAASSGWLFVIAVLLGLSMMRSLVFWPWRLARWGMRQARWADTGMRSRNVRWADEWWS